MMGNEAIARGALEAGVMVAAAYPGTPSSEIIGSLSKVAKEREIYVEWSVNEKVALEVAAAASMSGLRSLSAMKQNGLNVACDYLFALNLTGTKGGMVLVVCDDPGGHSSSNEEDTRAFARMADIPLLEPSSFQEAKEMVQYAFDLSEKLKSVVMLRGVTRISHARGNVTLGELSKRKTKASFDTFTPFSYAPPQKKHALLHEKMKEVQDIFESSKYNSYQGPKEPEILIISSGTGIFYSKEAVELMDLESRVGILKIGTTWPLPEKLIGDHLLRTKKIMIVEEVDPFLELNVKEIWVDLATMPSVSQVTFYGKRSGHMPTVGEMTTDKVIEGLKKVLGLAYESRNEEYAERSKEIESQLVCERALGFCPGCPHRASYWSIKNAIKLDDQDGFLNPDIGCYALARTASGFFLSKTGGAMGSGTGLACGFGKLRQFGFEQSVISVCGDSTFFHAAMPALVNAQYSESNFLMCILDNSATAMTGFQPHAGIGKTAIGDPSPVLDIESIVRAMGIKVVVKDPFNVQDTTDTITNLLQEKDGVKVLILKQKCVLTRGKGEKAPFRMHIDAEKCVGQSCGCNQLCTRIFRCPGILWNSETGKAEINQLTCTGCGVCADVCPNSAIIKEEE
jgi:indolepyruvate ferredoxin oxidoreductase alpha subunit